MDEIRSRDEAIRRYLTGDHPAEICRALGRSKPWPCMWPKRMSRRIPPRPRVAPVRPHHLTGKTPQGVERLVCELQQRLVQTRYAQRGAFVIPWQLRQLGVQPLPAIWTTSRLSHPHGLAGKRPDQPRGTPYPALAARRPYQVQQLDFVGRRDLMGAECF